MDELELSLGARFDGLGDAEKYADILEEIAQAEERIAKNAAMAAQAEAREASAAHKRFAEAQDKAMSYPSGPHQRLDATRQQLQQARAEGASGSVIADLELTMNRLVAQVARSVPKKAAPPSIQDALAAMEGSGNPFDLPGLKPGRAARPEPSEALRLSQALLSTRFGGAVSPLVGRSASALGVESPTALLTDKLEGLFPALAAKAGTGIMSKLGPIGLAAGVAASALAELTQQAIEAGRRFVAWADETTASTARLAQSRDIAGGTIGESALLAAFGLTAQDARSFKERITTDPIAMSAAAGVGVSGVPGPYGTQDTAGLLLKAIDGLARISDPTERMRQARLLGVEDRLWMTRLSQQTRAQLGRDAALSGRINDAGAQAGGAEYQASRSRFDQSMENLSAALAPALLDPITDFFNGTADAINAAAEFAKTAQPLLKMLTEEALLMANILGTVLSGGIAGPILGLMNMARGAGDRKSDPVISAQVEATMANTEAINRLNRVIGGGARTGRAIPSELRGRNLGEAINSGDLRWGTL